MRIFLLSLLAIIQSSAYAQKTTTKNEDGKAVTYTYIEQMPEFPGDLREFVDRHQGHPVDDAGNKLTGRVVVRFYVLKTGNISDIVVVKKVHPKLDADAISVIKKMPKWKPGRIEDEPVKVAMTIPIAYK